MVNGRHVVVVPCHHVSCHERQARARPERTTDAQVSIMDVWHGIGIGMAWRAWAKATSGPHLWVLGPWDFPSVPFDVEKGTCLVFLRLKKGCLCLTCWMPMHLESEGKSKKKRTETDLARVEGTGDAGSTSAWRRTFFSWCGYTKSISRRVIAGYGSIMS